MIADRADFVRAGHLDTFHLPGGDSAAKQTFRPGLGLLFSALGESCMETPPAKKICPDSQTRKMILLMMQKSINSPLTSSLGRLFDGVAGLLGVATANRYEGQAPMLLEVCGREKTDAVYPYELKTSDGMTIIHHQSIIKEIVNDIEQGNSVSGIASKFHNTVAAFLADAVVEASVKSGLRKAVFSGGCFVNRSLTENLKNRLEDKGITCFLHHRLPCNDGGISVGQAAIAAERLKREMIE
jgi:hydrogenase maturation protein HypF